jgi:cytosine/adenosine deaminase-related metal-dependent hydrolase
VGVAGYCHTMSEFSGVTPGLVCSHHHLYSALARGMPAPRRTPERFLQILERVWWRLDAALDLDMIEWSAKLGAVEALMSGCTAIIDHHESPNAIDGSLSIIADACAEVGVRVNCAYGVTDRHGPEGAIAGLAENERFLREGGRGMVGIHAAFTCSETTLDEAIGLAQDLGVGVHVHVAEGVVDSGSGTALARKAEANWLLVHGVHLPDGIDLAGTVVHNPRSNMNNGVGYAQPTRFRAPVALGTDGIGADMLEEFRLAFAKHREADVTASPETAWTWLETGWDLFPEARDDVVSWNVPTMEPWHLAYTTGVRALDIVIDGEPVLLDGLPTRVDLDEVRAKAAEQAGRLFARLA